MKIRQVVSSFAAMLLASSRVLAEVSGQSAATSSPADTTITKILIAMVGIIVLVAIVRIVKRMRDG